jgi:fructose-bisphosphate aldolase class II
MPESTSPPRLSTLAVALPVAERGGYALGSFSPRVLAMIEPVLRAAEQARSPLIVQIAAGELRRYHLTPEAFAEEFRRASASVDLSVPVVLHLDHTKDTETITRAIAAGFTSVMIDASELPLAENIARSREIAEYAHQHGVSVEAELGRIGTTDMIETDEDVELFTDPAEAEQFVRETGIDALAVSVGTAHGVYLVRQPRIDLERIRAIRSRTGVHLVLHGGSGVPPEMMLAAIRLPGGGVSKVNIATDLELAALGAIGATTQLTSAQWDALPQVQRDTAGAAVTSTVIEKMRHFLGSAGKADPAQ